MICLSVSQQKTTQDVMPHGKFGVPLDRFLRQFDSFRRLLVLKLQVSEVEARHKVGGELPDLLFKLLDRLLLQLAPQKVSAVRQVNIWRVRKIHARAMLFPFSAGTFLLWGTQTRPT